ncbi:hypothetical protein ONS95_014263 [Cadophora gregata]|uniref:uncharacterized protein n=1 Tax=Cadophora gregata TaxID=51156 RepID=UPI0026DA8268|nr:uncharacterized protein ONS95_014263 [Cadophora gregata]KAK0114022.1 hypothetical protein ONS96_014867 [Cadophora gregata f. sp. sojae]KAK0114783.1 hypothetical protein ONS95_014263 [Cadophora gregata]
MGLKSRVGNSQHQPLDNDPGNASHNSHDRPNEPQKRHPYNTVHREWLGVAVSEGGETPKPVDGPEASSLNRWLQESMREEPYNVVAEFRTVEMAAADSTACGSCVGAVMCESCIGVSSENKM